jgi:hypothetical protein
MYILFSFNTVTLLFVYVSVTFIQTKWKRKYINSTTETLYKFPMA